MFKMKRAYQLWLSEVIMGDNLKMKTFETIVETMI